MYPVGKIKYLNLLIWCIVECLNICGAFSQSIEYNQQLLLQNQSAILRNITVNNDSLIISGEIGADASELQGVFILTCDTLGNLGQIKIFKDPKDVDHILLNGSNSILYDNEKLVFSGEILWKSDNYFITYNSKTGDTYYKEYSAPFLVRFTESLLELSGAFYVVGYIQTQDFDLDMFIQKIDSSGNKIWEKTYGMPSKDETGRAAIIEDDGLTIMVSESFDITPTIKNDTRYWIRFMHVDSSGSIVRDWREEVTGEEGWSGTLLKYRDDYIYTCNTIGDEIGIGPLTGGQIVRRDNSFNLVWRKRLGDPDSPFTGLGDMIFSPDSCLLVTGQNVDSSMTFNAARILKIGLDGKVIWELRDTGYAFPDGQSLNFMEGIASSSCSSIYAVGYTYKSAGFYEGLLLKVSGDGCVDTLCTTTAIEDILRLSEQKIDAYPNPMQYELNIVLDESLPPDASVSIYNTMGHLVFSGYIEGNVKTISVADWPVGLYVIQAISKGRVVASIKVVRSSR